MSKRSRKEDNAKTNLLLAIKTGKYIMGFNNILRAVVQKRVECIVMSSNYKPTYRKMLEYYSVLAGGVPILFYDATNRELGDLLEMKRRVGCMAIFDQGEADLIPSRGN
jgi:large subunit ribosomal protein L30e